jgi:ribosomal protein S6
MSKKETKTTENAKLYELGFHINPTLAEEKANAVFSQIKDVVTNNKGEVVKEGALKNIKFAYTIIKKIDGVNERFTNAYFGWVKFNAESDVIAKIKKAVDNDASIIRYIFVKTVDDFEHSTEKLAAEMAESEEVSSEEIADTEDKSESKKDAEAPKDEVDKAIEKLTE